MEIRYINAAGGGFNGRREIPDGTSIDRFFEQVMPGSDRAKFNIRINNAAAIPGQVIQPNDLVSIIPGKYDGGAFGGDFVANLKAAAQLGAVVRQTPGIVDDLRAVNDLGTAIKAVPDLAENITAVIQFFRAVQTPDDAAPRTSSYETATPAPSRNVVVPGHVQLVTGYGLGRPEPAEGTIRQLFDRVKPGHRPDDYLILVNGSTVDADYALTEGDSIVIRSLDEVRGRSRTGTSY
jgi:hypothetical protein